MDKDFEFVELFEIYKDLLTDKQRELFSSYYLFDLSLSEIADVEGGSRQSVYDAVKKVKIKLSEYEKILGIQEKTKRLKELADTTKDENTARAIREIIER